ncbi:hypothetical protein [Streptomyces sp. NBC_00996]|uniref:hypothetical protein n=1 Tax=Streptomyces sp. NBC_00996 TaxID=2903710 RepID=UPI00386C56E5|nr:hypothetical protein OG390_45545 [Streptomyces sp. NBC_00996]
MALLRRGRARTSPLQFHERVAELQRRYEESGIAKDIVDESWRQVRHCFVERQLVPVVAGVFHGGTAIGR